MTDQEQERALFAYQVFTIVCQDAGGMDQPPKALKRLVQKAVISCNAEELFKMEPISGSELVEALRVGPMLVTRKAQELRRAASAWEAEFPSPQVLDDVISKLVAGR